MARLHAPILPEFGKKPIVIVELSSGSKDFKGDLL